MKKKKTLDIDTILKSDKKTAGKKVQSYKWFSRNKKILQVVKGGKAIKAKGRGTTYLEARNKKKNEVKLLLKITVGVPVSKIKLPKSEYVMTVHTNEHINYKIVPSNASNKKLYYEISDSGVIDISESGVITANKTGTTSVIVKSQGGCCKTECSVTGNAEVKRNVWCS